MCFLQLRKGQLVERLASFFELDDAQPLPLHLGHGRCTAHDGEPVVDQPDEVVEIAVAVFGVAEPVADFL